MRVFRSSRLWAAWAFALLCSGAVSHAAPLTSVFSYQGRLLVSSNAVPGNQNLIFGLYDSALGGLQVGPLITNSVRIDASGTFSTLLDFGTSTFNGESRWLELSLITNGTGGFATLQPRQPITATPYAITAGNVTGTISASQLTGAVPSTALSGPYSEPLTLSNPANQLSGNGAGLTALNASKISGGTVPDARLSSNVPLKNADNLFTGNNSIAGSFAGNAAGLTNFGAYVTPYDFGAVGNGIADDTVALQKWLDSAAESGRIALLPPAKGPYYKITDTLYVTNYQGMVKIVGSGGQMHISATPWSKCRIHQATPGKHGILIGGAGQPMDSFSISGVLLTCGADNAPPASNDNHGLSFNGRNGDTDCATVESCGVHGFGAGLFVASAANLTVIGCSFSGNMDGVRVSASTLTSDPPVVNQMLVTGCQMSYNYSNQVHIANAGSNLHFFDADLASIPFAGYAPRGIYMEGGGYAVFENCDMERYTDCEEILATSTNNTFRGYLKIERCGIYASSLTPNTYSIIATNFRVELFEAGLNAYSTADGFAVLDANSVDGRPCVQDFTPEFIPEKLIVNSTVYTNYIGQDMIPKSPNGVLPGTLQQGHLQSRFHTSAWDALGNNKGGSDDTTSLDFGARFYGFNGSRTTVTTDLLQYQKDLMTRVPAYSIFAKNQIVATNGFISQVITTNSSYTAALSNEVILVNGSGVTITLPTAVGNAGKKFTVKLIATGTASISAASGQKIDAAATYILSAQYKFAEVVSDGTQWFVVASN